MSSYLKAARPRGRAKVNSWPAGFLHESEVSGECEFTVISLGQLTLIRFKSMNLRYLPKDLRERWTIETNDGPPSYLIGKRTSLNWRCIYLRNDTSICVEDDIKPDVGHFSFVADSGMLRVSTIFVVCPPINQAASLHLTCASF